LPSLQDPNGVLSLEGGGAEGEGEGGYDSGDEHNALIPLEVRAARATLRRKYRQLERALEEDHMLFEVRQPASQPAHMHTYMYTRIMQARD
jgi:hypothetical protein